MSDDSHVGWAKRLAEKIEEGPVRFLVPGVIVAALAVSVVNGYTPLEFQAPEASATTQKENLDKKVDASKLEKKSPSKKVAAKSSVNAADLKDGTYTGYSRCTEDGVFDYWLCLDVTISGGKVVNISNVRGSGTGKAGSVKLGNYDTRNIKYLNWAIKGRGSQEGVVSQLLDSAVKGDLGASIDTVSGATYSSQSILEAYQDALSQASVSGTSVVTPKASTASSQSSSKQKKVKTTSAISADTKLADGVWQGYDRCTEEDQFDYYVAVDVTVKNGKVTKLSNVHGSSTGNKGSKKLDGYDSINDTYLGWAANGHNSQTGVVKQITSVIKQGKIASSIDTVSGATYSSQSILRAYLDALKKSAAAAGSSTTIPDSTDNSSTDNGSTDNGNDDSGNGDSGNTDNGNADGGKTDDSGTDAIENPNSGFTDGTYTAYGLSGDANGGLEFSPYYVGVTITVADGKISDLASENIAGDAEGVVDPSFVYNSRQNSSYLSRAINGYGISGKHPGLLKQINTGLDAGSALVSYDTITGATYSSNAIIDAYTKAVALAKPAEGTNGSDDNSDSGDAASSETGVDGTTSADGAQETSTETAGE